MAIKKIIAVASAKGGVGKSSLTAAIAIEKAKGTGGEDYAEARYEGFGPGNCMVIIDCLTDNGNRTIKDVRQCFTKTHSKIGSSGTVSHMFDHQAVFAFKGDDDER